MPNGSGGTGGAFIVRSFAVHHARVKQAVFSLLLTLVLLPVPASARAYRVEAAPGSKLLIVSGVKLPDLEDSQLRTEALKRLSQQVYAQYRDEADFLLLVANRRVIPPETRIAGYEYRVQNGVQGIGAAHFNAGAQFGGTRRLQGILYFPRWYAFWRSPFLHEFAHQWANDALPTTEPGHFGFCGAGSQLGGFSSLNPLGGGVYQGLNRNGRPFGTASNGDNSVPYSDLELYLMGFLSAPEVRPFQCAVNPQWVGLARGLFRAQRLNTVTIQDIIRRNGPRVPDATTSPKTFRILAVLVSEGPPAPSEVRLAEQQLQGITAQDNGDSTYTFWEATRGRGRLDIIAPARIRR